MFIDDCLGQPFIPDAVSTEQLVALLPTAVTDEEWDPGAWVRSHVDLLLFYDDDEECPFAHF